MAKNHFIRWNSRFPAQANEVTPNRGLSGDIVLPDAVIEAVIGGDTLSCDPDDPVAVAVIDATRVNIERGVYGTPAEPETNTENPQA